MLYRKDLKIEQLETVFKSFEFKELYSSASIIRITRSSASIIHIVFICRQPISARNGLTYALFFDEFSTLLEPLVSAFGKLLLAGDLNFHVNNPSEANAYQFLDVLSCFNLNTSNVIIPIHKSINLLDLIITRSGKDTSFIYQSTTPVISKHSAVHCILDFERPSNKKLVLASRKLSNMSTKHIKTV